MKNKQFSYWSVLLVLLTSALFSVATCQSAAARPAPAVERQIVGFYRWYMGEVKRDRDPVKQRTTIRRYVSQRLAKWLASPAYREYGADYFVDAQDFDSDWDQARVSQVTIKGKTATAMVTLGHPKPSSEGIGVRKLRLQMVKESGIWKIDRVNGQR